jgi:peptidoglycan/LPS O-acetylase OafA/YrhL
MSTPKIRPASLTSLRFFAVMLIVVHHLRQPLLPSLLQNEKFDNAGIIGVTFFLFLSGFVMPLNYGTCNDIKNYFYFVWNRLVRVYPVHILTFLLSLIIIFLYNEPLKLHIAFINIFLLQSYLPFQRIFFSFNFVSWILSTLFFFYFIFPVVNQRPKFLWGAILSSVGCLIISMAYIETSQNPPILWLLYIFPANRLLVCLAGVISSMLFLALHQKLKNSKGKYLASILELFSMLLLIDFIFWGNLTIFLDRLLFIIPFKKSIHPLNLYFTASTLPAFFILMTFGFEMGIISQFLAKRVFVFLGNISFSLFMFHQLFFRFLGFFRESLFNTLGVSVTIVLAVIMVMPFSFLIYHYIENPMRNKLRIRSPETMCTQDIP